MLTLGLNFIQGIVLGIINDEMIYEMGHSSREHLNPQMTSSQRQWLHSSVD